MPDPSEAPKNPVQYAEEVLDVHGPWEEAKSRLEQHTEASTRLFKVKQQVRAAKSDLDDQKRDIIARAPAMDGYPTNKTAQREFVKLLIEVDPDCIELQQTIADCQASLDDAQSDVKHHEIGLSVLSSRMAELGGLLHFYAAAKEAQTAQQRVQHNDTQEST
jgi:signal transduction histidine kinase